MEEDQQLHQISVLSIRATQSVLPPAAHNTDMEAKTPLPSTFHPYLKPEAAPKLQATRHHPLTQIATETLSLTTLFKKYNFT